MLGLVSSTRVLFNAVVCGYLILQQPLNVDNANGRSGLTVQVIERMSRGVYAHSCTFCRNKVQPFLNEVLVVFFRHANLIPVTALGTGLQFGIHRGVWDDQLPLRFAACLEVACKFTPARLNKGKWLMS